MKTGQPASPVFSLTTAAIIGIGICPALAGATGVREAVILGLGMVVVQLLTMAVLLPVRRLILPDFAPIITVAAAGGFTTGLCMIGFALIPDLFSSISLYAYLTPAGLPVLCIVRWLRHCGVTNVSARECLTAATGAAVLLASIGALRELLGTGTIGGTLLLTTAPFPWVTTVPGGVTIAAFNLSTAAVVLGLWKKMKAGGAA